MRLIGSLAVYACLCGFFAVAACSMDYGQRSRPLVRGPEDSPLYAPPASAAEVDQEDMTEEEEEFLDEEFVEQ